MNAQRIWAFTCMVLVAVCFSTWAVDQKAKPKSKTAEPVPFCLDEQDFIVVKSAFDNALRSSKLADGCIPGQRSVKLEEKTAYNLLFAIAQGLGLPRHEAPNTKPKKSARYGEQSGRWKCETCGATLWLDEHVGLHHVDSSRDGDHPAKLSQADLKIIADGLRMSD